MKVYEKVILSVKLNYNEMNLSWLDFRKKEETNGIQLFQFRNFEVLDLQHLPNPQSFHLNPYGDILYIEYKLSSQETKIFLDKYQYPSIMAIDISNIQEILEFLSPKLPVVKQEKKNKDTCIFLEEEEPLRASDLLRARGLEFDCLALAR